LHKLADARQDADQKIGGRLIRGYYLDDASEAFSVASGHFRFLDFAASNLTGTPSHSAASLRSWNTWTLTEVP
jgi:hypothetical protein